MEIGKPTRLTDKKSIVQKIIGEFRNALITRTLKPGDKLPTEIELSRRFFVSRNAVREAIKMLVALGVVEIKRGNGTYVAKGISTQIIDPLIFSLLLEGGVPDELLELREMLEIGILEIVLKKVTKKDINKMEKAIQLLEEDCKKGETDREILRKHDLEFHYAFAGATHNPLIIKIAKTIWEMFKASIEKAVYSRPEDTVERHKMILKAIKEKNLEKAKEAIYLSLEKWGRDLHTYT
ncbi:MAG TPA: FadR family transcriptional regulator [Candidatus Aerophobetes bacterium]|uniref:FadR family transcriptional regulator n=1 Tax=Aerophobetes bacterium TaxID=2030807 RepID=A0A662DFQ4_UNCAE|nr:MAG: FadR family transcriptional regulator [Candidatus Aerophobetes bacterium]HDN85063.1 FadR family transcriptional regulator [Candidatus Aerophobetes bacterium]